MLRISKTYAKFANLFLFLKVGKFNLKFNDTLFIKRNASKTSRLIYRSILTEGGGGVCGEGI